MILLFVMLIGIWFGILRGVSFIAVLTNVSIYTCKKINRSQMWWHIVEEMFNVLSYYSGHAFAR